MASHDEAVRRVLDFEHRETLRLIEAELRLWGYSMTRLPKHFTIEMCLRIVGAT